jgi:hypothetical protein
MTLYRSTIQKLKNVPGNSIVCIAIRNNIEENPAQTIKMVRQQINDNKRLMTELIGEDLVREVDHVLFV